MITSIIKVMLLEGKTYGEIMQVVYAKCPHAKTTHKSIASIACNMRQLGGLNVPKQQTGGFQKKQITGVLDGLNYSNF